MSSFGGSKSYGWINAVGKGPPQKPTVRARIPLGTLGLLCNGLGRSRAQGEPARLALEPLAAIAGSGGQAGVSTLRHAGSA